MRNYIARGEIITATATDAIASGDFVKIGGGGLIGIAAISAIAGDDVEVALTGVFEVPKAAVAIAQGDKLYYVDADRNLSKTAAGNTFAGYAYDDAAAGDPTVKLTLANGL